jgi:EAL domain-containing protein (putative c-di-GMP-specific phosphodiesterase class I)
MVDGTTTVTEVVRAADVAAQEAQQAGGGRVVRHDTVMTDDASERLGLETALGAAVRDRTWWLDYQPIADIRTGDVVAAEALLRFPDDVETYPMILVAEANGLIVPLGLDILAAASAAAAAWATEGLVRHVHVNVSGHQLGQPGFVDEVAAVLGRTGLDPRSLTLELTETAVIDDLSEARQILDALAALGARTALDDFGTGQSSLRVLASLPFNAVKLDHFLTADVATSHRARALVGATVEFARVLDMVVIAEGVEDEQQLGILRDLGCDQMQGFLMSPAVPAADLRDAVARAPSDAGQGL